MNLKFAFLALSFFAFTGNVNAKSAQQRSTQIISEFETLKAQLLKTKANQSVGGYYSEKKIGKYSVLWALGGSAEVIRIFRFAQPGEGKDFAVTYHKNSAIIPGRLVLRRFIGPEPVGWMNETIDYKTGEYLGVQGNTNVGLSKADIEFLSKLGIRP